MATLTSQESDSVPNPQAYVNLLTSARLGTDTVDILVGAPGKSFVLHEKLLTDHSPVLEAAFKPNHFLEGQTKSLMLDEEHPGAFELLVNWLYTKRLPDISYVPCVPYELREEREEGFINLLRLFSLADNLLIGEQFKIDVMDCVVRTFLHQRPTGRYFPISIVPEILRNTAEDCPFRRLVLDLASRDILNRFADGNSKGRRRLGLAFEGCNTEQTAEVATAVLANEWGKCFFRWLQAIKDDPTKSVANIDRYHTGFLAGRRRLPR